MWPTGMSIHCVCDRAGAPPDPSESVRDDRNSVHLYTSGRFAELRSNGNSVSFVNFLPDELAHAPCKFGSARLWSCAYTIQIQKREFDTWDYPTMQLAQFRLAECHCSSTNIVGASPTNFAPVEQFSSPSSMVISPGSCHDQSIPVRKFAARLRT